MLQFTGSCREKTARQSVIPYILPKTAMVWFIALTNLSEESFFSRKGLLTERLYRRNTALSVLDVRKRTSGTFMIFCITIRGQTELFPLRGCEKVLRRLCFTMSFNHMTREAICHL